MPMNLLSAPHQKDLHERQLCSIIWGCDMFADHPPAIQLLHGMVR